MDIRFIFTLFLLPLLQIPIKVAGSKQDYAHTNWRPNPPLQTVIDTTPAYDRILPFGTTGYFLTAQGKKYTLCNSTGAAIREYTFDWVVSADSLGNCIAVQNDKYGLYKRKNDSLCLLTPILYDNIRAVGNRFVVTQDLQRGLLSPDGKLLFPPQYYYFEQAGNACWVIHTGAAVGVMRENGAVVIPFEYSHIEPELPGGFILEKDEKLGFATPNGKVLLAVEYDAIEPITDQFGAYLTVKNGREKVFKP